MTRNLSEPTVYSQVATQGSQGRQLARRPPGPATYEIKVFSDTQTLSIGDGQFVFAIPDELDRRRLANAHAFVSTVSSSGKPTVMIRNITQAQDMLSTAITIDVSAFTSFTASVPPVVDTSVNRVDGHDLIAIDVDAAGTGAKGLGVMLRFY